MNYIQWCDYFLTQLTAAGHRDPQSRGYTNLAILAQELFGLDPTQGYGDQYRLSALHTAASDLQRLGLTEPHHNLQLWRTTPTGAQTAGQFSSLWPTIQGPALHPNDAAIVHAINRLSPHDADHYAWVETVDDATILAAAQWQGNRGDFLKRTTILQQAGSHFLERVGSYQVRATYSGLVWEEAHR